MKLGPFVLGAAVLLTIIVLVTGSHSGHHAVSATQTSTTSTTTTATTTTGTRTSPSAASISHEKKLLAEASAFLSAFYAVGPQDTDGTVRARLREISGSTHAFSMDVDFARTVSFGLVQIAYTEQARFNQVIWQKQLTLQGKAETSKQQTKKLNPAGTKVQLSLPLTLRAFLPDKKEDKSLHQEVQTRSTWLFKSGKWIIRDIAVSPPGI